VERAVSGGNLELKCRSYRPRRAGSPAIVLRKRIEHSITTGHHGSGLRSFR
jgi:hypothetical protein